jgi:glycosyltransferase involved in cell wall biosynthesis
MTPAPPSGPTVGYLTKRFPRLSETFILDEILGLERAGVPLRLFAVANSREAISQPDIARVASPVTYLRGRRWFGIPRGVVTTIAAHGRLAARDPHRYSRAFALARRERARSGTIRPFLDAGRLAIHLRRVGATHLHAAFAHGPASTARYIHHLTGLPFSFAAHAKDLYLSDPVSLAEKVADAEFVLTCSSAASAGLAERAGSSSKIILAYHGVDTTRFRPATVTGRPRSGPGVLRILAVGRLVPKKGYPVLLGALRILLDCGRDVSCRIIGGGTDRDELARLIDTLGLGGRVELAGARTHQEIAAAYRDADVFVQSSVVLPDGDRDGIPNALLEAMASGLPVVASAVSGIPEAVEDGVSGLLVRAGDPDGLAQALARIGDDGALARLAAGAQARAIKDFDRQACADRIAPLFLAGHPRPAGQPVVSLTSAGDFR